MGKAMQTWAVVTALFGMLDPRGWWDIGVYDGNSYRHIKHRSQSKKRKIARRRK